MDAFLIEIQDSFLSESKDLLASIETLFLKLEKNPNDRESYVILARLAHNFKGSGKAVGFDSLAEFCHELENLLVALRNGEMKPSAQIVDLLLECIDQLKDDIRVLSADKSAVLNHTALTRALQTALASRGETMPGESKTSIQHSETESGRLPQTAGVDPGQSVAMNAESTSIPSLEAIAVEKGSASPHSSSSAAGKKLSQSPSAPRGDDYLKIPMGRIEFILDAFGEQMILQSALEKARTSAVVDKDSLNRTVMQLGKITYDLQQEVLKLRMVNLQSVSAKLERAVRDAARVSGKKIDFTFEGSERELDKTVVDTIGDALLHMVRNSVDHAIEDAMDRLASGKPEAGQVTLRAKPVGGLFEIQISDDGKGLDVEGIKKKAIERGLLSPDARPSDPEVYNLIFASGFSTKEVTSELSGRGVGMNVVKEAVDQLNGSIRIETSKGKGTTFYITLPLSLAIFNGLVFSVGEESYVTANSAVEEIVKIKDNEIIESQGLPYLVKVRDHSYPVVDLSRRLVHRQSRRLKGYYTALLVKGSDGEVFSLFVDAVLENQKIVQKKIGLGRENHEGATAATILGDGTVALILDLRYFQPKRSVSGASTAYSVASSVAA